MTLERIPELFSFYGREAILLIGIGLQRAGPDLVANSRRFRQLVEQAASPTQSRCGNLDGQVEGRMP